MTVVAFPLEGEKDQLKGAVSSGRKEAPLMITVEEFLRCTSVISQPLGVNLEACTALPLITPATMSINGPELGKMKRLKHKLSPE